MYMYTTYQGVKREIVNSTRYPQPACRCGIIRGVKSIPDDKSKLGTGPQNIQHCETQRCSVSVITAYRLTIQCQTWRAFGSLVDHLYQALVSSCAPFLPLHLFRTIRLLCNFMKFFYKFSILIFYRPFAQNDLKF